MIQFRQATRADEPAIWTYLCEFYGARASTKYPERWYWQFVKNPFATGDGLPVFLALDGNKVVGQLALQRGDIWCGNRNLPCAWGVDFGVLPAFQGRGAGSRLQSLAGHATPLLLSASLDARAARIKQHLGFALGPGIVRMSRFLSVAASDVRRYLQWKTANRGRLYQRIAKTFLCCPGAAEILARCLNHSNDLYSRTRRPRPLPAVTVEEISDFTAGFDDLWDQNKQHYLMTTPRTARYLKWRFVDCPGLDYRKFKATLQGQTVGYIVVRERVEPELRSTAIVDVFCAHSVPQAAPGLVAAVLETPHAQGSFVETCCSAPSYLAVFRQLGFLTTGTRRGWIGGSEAGNLAQSAAASQWFITMADHDSDQFRPIAPLATARAGMASAAQMGTA